jgi:hypothetical protein
MVVDVLGFAGCPNVEPALALVERVLAECGVDAVVIRTDVSDPADVDALRRIASWTPPAMELRCSRWCGRARCHRATASPVLRDGGGVGVGRRLVTGCPVGASAAGSARRQDSFATLNIQRTL